MLEDLIIETKPIDRTQLSEQEKVVIDHLESIELIDFDLTRNNIYFIDKVYNLINYWNLKNDGFVYDYEKIYVILRNKYSYNYKQVNDLVKDILLKYHKIKVTTIDTC